MDIEVQGESLSFPAWIKSKVSMLNRENLRDRYTETWYPTYALCTTLTFELLGKEKPEHLVKVVQQHEEELKSPTEISESGPSLKSPFMSSRAQG